MREIKVRHPDGRIWYVRHRWVRRRAFWRTRTDWAAEATNPDGPYGEREVKRLVLPDGEALLAAAGWLDLFDLFSVSGLVAVLLLVLVLPLILISFVIAGARHALAWVTANPAAALAVLVGVAGVVALLLLRRPWLVVAQRLGAGDDVPRHAWLVTGWRRSRAFARELAAAIQAGRFSQDGVLSLGRDPRTGRRRAHPDT